MNSQFYKMMLWLYSFKIYIYNDNSWYFYYHLEMQASKNGNSVVLFLYNCIKINLNKFHNIKTVLLMSDVIGGQNWNNTIKKCCVWFSKIHKVELIHLYPVHVQMQCQCNQNFALVCNILKIKNRDSKGMVRGDSNI